MEIADRIRRRPTGALVVGLVAVLGLIAIIWGASRHTHMRQSMAADAPSTGAVPAVARPAAPATMPATPTSDELATPSAGAAPGPSEAEVARVIKSESPALKVCYQRALSRDDKLIYGNLNVHLAIGSSGAVKTVAVSGTPDFRVLDPCLKAAISKWQFPAAAESYRAQFPLQFRGSS